MPSTTRAHTIRRHLVDGGLIDLGLTEREQQAGPDGHPTDGFSVRQQHYAETGVLVVVAGAFGPFWIRTLSEISGRLEQPFVKCTVISEAPGLSDHEVLVRWATSEELRARKAAAAQRQASLAAALRAVEQRQALEDAGQPGLF
ncbi:hypothetical protein ACFC51_32635 [Streptomyces sp. NPDC055962]|uniref:hypothetical protein n=1 Tax=Streptomyces sp. NPDC055962 TaxID=3345667 RepID=UPI0035D5F1FA